MNLYQVKLKVNKNEDVETFVVADSWQNAEELALNCFNYFDFSKVVFIAKYYENIPVQYKLNEKDT